MTLIQRFSFFFTFLFSILLAAVMISVYQSFTYFREKEFQNRLVERAETTVNLLFKAEGIDSELLKVIDNHTVNRLYKRKVLVLDDKFEVLYRNSNDESLKWTSTDIARIRKDTLIFTSNGPYEVLGAYYKINDRDYYVIISAEDKYGNTKLDYLKYILFSAFVVSTILVWILSFYLSKRSLKPLDKVRKSIQEITDRNLNKRLPEPEKDDELKALSNSFNQMMDRIDTAYQKQKEFTGNASHELRTPIAKMLVQLENVLNSSNIPDQVKDVLESVTEDTSQLSEIVTSLLLLSEIDSLDVEVSFPKIRLDEIIFNSASRVSKLNRDLKFQFDIEDNCVDIDLEIEADETLLQIAFNNLIRNAYLYSDNKSVKCVVSQTDKYLVIVLTNTGVSPDVSDTSILFNTFSRGSNTEDKAGSGIGLSIVKRILQYHNALIDYSIPTKDLNRITVKIPRA